MISLRPRKGHSKDEVLGELPGLSFNQLGEVVLFSWLGQVPLLGGKFETRIGLLDL